MFIEKTLSENFNFGDDGFTFFSALPPHDALSTNVGSWFLQRGFYHLLFICSWGNRKQREEKIYTQTRRSRVMKVFGFILVLNSIFLSTKRVFFARAPRCKRLLLRSGTKRNAKMEVSSWAFECQATGESSLIVSSLSRLRSLRSEVLN